MQVYLISPQHHGNGGWCGTTVHCEMDLQDALNLSLEELARVTGDYSLDDLEVMICHSKDIYDRLFTICAPDFMWEEHWVGATL